jgi:hypothetical protein
MVWFFEYVVKFVRLYCSKENFAAQKTHAAETSSTLNARPVFHSALSYGVKKYRVP